MLKDKDGIETDQGLLLAAVLSHKKEGNHLCHSMLLPSNLAKENKEKFIKNGKAQFDGASVEKFNKHVVVTLENNQYLNAEDERTLLPLEAAIDLAILDKDTLTTLNLSGKSVAGKNIEIKNTNYKDFSLNYNFNQTGDSITNNYTPDDNSAEEN